MVKIELDQIVKQSGKRTDGFINIAQKADYTWFQIPVIILEGKDPGPTLLLEACIHGDEHEGTEAVLKIAKEFQDGSFAGTVIGIPALNTEAFAQVSRNTMTDGANMNRVFPTPPRTYITNRIGAEYEERFIKNVDYSICLHGGGQVLHLEPIVNGQNGDSDLAKTTREMAEAYNFKYQWRPSPEYRPINGYAGMSFDNNNVPSICAECGSQCGRLYDREKNVQLHFQGIKNVMAYLKMIPDTGDEPVEKIEVYLYYLHARHGGIHKIAKRPNEFVKEGEVLTYIEDIFGNLVEEVKAPFDGIVNGFWSPGVIRPGDWSSLFLKPVEK